MALINCPECGKQVSDAAAACPGCAYPLSQATQQQPKPKQAPKETVVTTQRTSKKWKLMQLIGALLLIIGVISLIAGANSNEPSAAGMPMIVIGILLFIVARAGSWWCHD